jgi:hypothetical protein
MGSLCLGTIPLEELETAIAQSRLGYLKSLLHKVEQEPLSKQARVKLLGNLYDTAAELTDTRLENLSFIRSWKDMGKFFAGTTIFIGGIGSLITAFLCGASEEKHLQHFSFYFKTASVFLIPGGAYLGYKGYSCSDQRYMISQATEVEEYIDSVLNNTELLEDDETSENL